MAQTFVGLGYSTATGRLRFVVVPNNDAELSAHATLGITVLSITNAQYAAALNHAALQALVNTARGSAPVNDRVVWLAPSGKVLGAVYYDPACGDVAPAGTTILAHATRDINWPPATPLRRSSLVGGAAPILRVIETPRANIFRLDG